MESDETDTGLLSRANMVRWFSPTLLAQAAMRAIVSPIFGTYADARMTQATIDGFAKDDLADAINRHRFTVRDVVGPDGAVWVDFLADTGDGFDPVYTMASLVAADSLEVARNGATEAHRLPAGKILILGGDEVYPYPSRDEYKTRLVEPYSMAFSRTTEPRNAFAIPGNHDWYDGLNAFDFLFCRERYGYDGTKIGCLQFRQHRSYFAIRLPYNWWVWGIDTQLSPYLDAGQVRYFQAVADEMKKRMDGEPDHKVILCVPEPGWQYEPEHAKAANSNMEIVSDVAASGNARIMTVLSGDSHHFSRYFGRSNGLNLIAAGGGGAFLHPTHQLRNTIEYKWLGKPEIFDLALKPPAKSGAEPGGQAVFPSKRTSFWLTWMNWIFPFINPTFAFLLGAFYWIMTWMYSQTQVNRKGCVIDQWPESRPLVADIIASVERPCALDNSSTLAYLSDLLVVSVKAGVHQFTLGIVGLLFLGCLVWYADAHRRWVRIVMGGLHWIVHLTVSVAAYLVITKWGYWTWFGATTEQFVGKYFFIGPDFAAALKTAAYIVQMIFGGGMIAGMVWGGYLFVFCAFFRRHWNDAFSSLRLMNYKNFLRMKLEPTRLTIYPIGLRRIPTRIEWASKGGVYVPRFKLAPELIDGPVVIEARDMKPSGRPIT